MVWPCLQNGKRKIAKEARTYKGRPRITWIENITKLGAKEGKETIRDGNLMLSTEISAINLLDWTPMSYKEKRKMKNRCC